MAVPFMFVDGNLTLVLDNKSYQVLPDHINYKMILEALPTATSDELLEIVDVQKAVATFSDGFIEIKNGQVAYQGEASMQSQKELYDFLEHEHLPITEDGYFLAYKAVRSDFKDKYRGTFDNRVGQVVSMQRAKVDDDRVRGCSDGLHAGALNYVAGYGSLEGGDKIVIVKINPRDVVSVPSDCNCEKLRTCQYEVVGEYQGELLKPLYSANFSDGEYADYEDEEDYDMDGEYWDQFDDNEDDDEDDYDYNYGGSQYPG